MAERATVYEGLQLGVESTAGTAVPALKRLRGLELEITPQTPAEALRPVGAKFAADVVRQKEHCEGTLRGQVCYTDLVYLLSSLLCEATVTTPTTNGEWTLDLSWLFEYDTYTLKFGGQTTTAIARNAEATAVQTALEALPTVGAGNVAVFGAAGGPFIIRGQRALERTDQALTGVPPDTLNITTTAATKTRRWTFVPANRGADSINSYTLVKGSAVGAERIAGALVRTLEMTFNRNEASLQAGVLGRALQSGYAVQSVRVTGGSGTASFTLTYRDKTTTAIAHNAEATAVQTALEALTTIGAGNVSVTGGAGEYVIAFTGALRDAEHAAITGAGTNCTVTVGNAASPGGGEVTNVPLAPVSPTQVSVYLGNSFLGMAKLTRLLEATLSVQERHLPVFTVDDSEPSFSATVEGAGDPTARITVIQNSEADAYLQRLRSRAQQWCRIVANGPEIEPGFNHRLEITFPCKFTSAGRGDTEGAYTGNYDLQVIYDPTAGYGLKVVVDTDLASL
jgi:ribonuclease HI